jgi:hypothetical protein
VFGALSGIVAGAEPVRAEASLVFRPEVWIGGWAAAVAALSALYVFDRRHRANRFRAARRVSPVPMTRDHIVPTVDPETDPMPAHVADPPRRTIDQLIKRKPGAPAGSPLPLPLRARSHSTATDDAAPAPESALLRRLRERGELVARVAAPVELIVESFDQEVEATDAPASLAAPPRRVLEEVAEPGPTARCAELREAGRFGDALRAARDGLARYADAPGPLLLELSRAAFALGRGEEAIGAARDALFVWRSRETVEHLIRVLTALHGFEPEDGDGLRRAVRRHPEQPLLRHAAGVYELSHGSREAAETQLRAALALDPDPEECAAIERDLERLLGPGAAAPA